MDLIHYAVVMQQKMPLDLCRSICVQLKLPVAPTRGGSKRIDYSRPIINKFLPGELPATKEHLAQVACGQAPTEQDINPDEVPE